MTHHVISRVILAFLLMILQSACSERQGTALPQDLKWRFKDQNIVVSNKKYSVQVPEFLDIELLNSAMKKPRIIFFHGERLFVGSSSGNVYWLDPPYKDATNFARLNNYPHSLVVRGNDIYFAKKNGIFKAAYTANTSWIREDQLELVASLPAGKGHSSRTLKLGPDNKLYVSLGISGNCSDQFLDNRYDFDARRGGIYQIDESTSPATLVPFASGLRNPIGYDWHPITATMYASNNGPDHLGFELPPEYFSEITPGSFHGMPWYQYDGGKLFRDGCITSDPPYDVKEVSVPVATFDSRNAPMDVAFYPENGPVNEFSESAIVALKGSWATAGDGSRSGDRATRRHPKIVLVEFIKGKATGNVFDLVLGFQNNDGKRWLRPVGVAVGPDGAIYFTGEDGVQGLYRLKKSSTD